MLSCPSCGLCKLVTCAVEGMTSLCSCRFGVLFGLLGKQLGLAAGKAGSYPERFYLCSQQSLPALSDSTSTECHAALPVQVRIRMSCLTYQAK